MLESFDRSLQRELEEVLQDPAFERSPVQSKLLKYLGEQTLAGTIDLSQYAIAVDGLGRPENYDTVNDSYPRVQVSRLRKNLASHYARNEPVEEGCIFLRRGDYRLHLASRDVAYPKAREFAEAKTDPVTAARDSATPPYAPVHDSLPVRQEPDSILTEPPHRKRSLRFLGWRKTAIFGAGAASTAALALLLSGQLASSEASAAPPLVGLNLTVGKAVEGSNDLEGITASTNRMARIQLANSFVSRLAPDDAADTAKYRLRINIGEDIEGRPEAYLALKNTRNRVLYAETAKHNGNVTDFLTEIEANITYLTSPTGLIAKNEIKSVRKDPASAFQCFLIIESLRSEGKPINTLVDKCLERFPDSNYSSIWLARQGFADYQQRILEDKPIGREGPGWAAIQASLEANRNNAFANIIAAKVELVLGNCVRAHTYLERGLARGNTYPTLVSSAIAEGTSCSENDQIRTDYRDPLISLASNNPDPDPLLHIYLTLAVLSLDRPDIARALAKSTKIKSPQGPVEEVSQFLRKRLLNKQLGEAELLEFEDKLRLFIWNRSARQELLKQLGKAAAEPT